MPSRKAIRVGMERMPAAARRRSASVSTLAKTMSGWAVDAFSKMGANMPHGPHQAAQKSTSTIPSPVTALSNVSVVSLCIAMRAWPAAPLSPNSTPHG